MCNCQAGAGAGAEVSLPDGVHAKLRSNASLGAVDALQSTFFQEWLRDLNRAEVATKGAAPSGCLTCGCFELQVLEERVAMRLLLVV